MGEVAESFETGLKEFESRIGGCENALNSFASAGDRKALEVVERELRAAGGILEDLSLLPDELDTNEESDAAWSRLGIARTRREELSKQMRRLVQENRAVLAHAARQELLQAAQEDTGKGEKSSMGQLASSITSGLRRTHALLENEVARTSTITEVVEDQTSTISKTGDVYRDLSAKVTTGQGTVRRLRTRERAERWAVNVAMIFFLLSVAFVLQRRVSNTFVVRRVVEPASRGVFMALKWPVAQLKQQFGIDFYETSLGRMLETTDPFSGGTAPADSSSEGDNEDDVEKDIKAFKKLERERQFKNKKTPLVEYVVMQEEEDPSWEPPFDLDVDDEGEILKKEEETFEEREPEPEPEPGLGMGEQEEAEPSYEGEPEPKIGLGEQKEAKDSDGRESESSEEVGEQRESTKSAEIGDGQDDDLDERVRARQARLRERRRRRYEEEDAGPSAEILTEDSEQAPEDEIAQNPDPEREEEQSNERFKLESVDDGRDIELETLSEDGAEFQQEDEEEVGEPTCEADGDGQCNAQGESLEKKSIDDTRDLEQEDDGFGEASELSSEGSSSKGDYIADAEQNTAAAVEDGDAQKDLAQPREASSESELVTDDQETYDLGGDEEHAAPEVLNEEAGGVRGGSDEFGRLEGVGDSSATLEESDIQQATDNAEELVIDSEHGEIEATEEEEESSATLSDDGVGKGKEKVISEEFREEAGGTLPTGKAAGEEEQHDLQNQSREEKIGETDYSQSEDEAPAGGSSNELETNSDQHTESPTDDDKGGEAEPNRIEDGMDHSDEISREHVVEVSLEETEQIDPDSALDDQRYDVREEDETSNGSMGKESQYTIDRVERLEEESSGADGGNLEQDSKGGEPATQAQQLEEDKGEGAAEHEDFVEASYEEASELNSSLHVAADDGSSNDTDHNQTDDDKRESESQAAEVDEAVDESTITSDFELHSEALDVEGDGEEHGVGEGKDAAAPDDILRMGAHSRVEASPSDTTESTLEEETVGEALTLEHFADRVDPTSPNSSENLLDEEGNYVFEHEANQFEDYEL
mmetsp:Transcript_33055/g.129870  ORF Transcript_33055/g.129870 Transcript_33055/m.129870 type:complete len:1047 (-) Transcript_33055:421-3561(-)|eukprot:CAMPEP_0113960972 /NCGR_PEP_ID=MMETSP0011_2-20120614/5033_1 /TAXON_ID=101924 /ORGANISM="Rhodosorus marinus" /LENGTH=1046 /DNA_ID=CAMNT_0000972527 /DNA_START=325 /DNA_END=3465 /DNA_ORIENTATION=+ /assembly_acc=CAM_ASM_000156